MSVRGFVYAPLGSPLFKVKMGELATIAVVHHRLETINVSSWPGRLLAAEVIEPARLGANEQVPPHYTRAARLNVLEELPRSQLFGPFGAQGRPCTEDLISPGLEHLRIAIGQM